MVAMAAGLVLVACCPLARAQQAAGPEAVFEELWQTLDRGYAAFEARGIDWVALHRVYRPRVTAATTDDQLFTVLSELLGHLNDNHVMLSSRNPSRRFCSGYLGRYWNDPTSRAAFLESMGRHPLPARYFRGSPDTTADGRFAYGWVSDGIGYLHFGEFRDPAGTAADLDTVLATFSGARALIVDVRCNGGGQDRVGQLIADRFADRRRLYMVTRERIGTGPDDLAPPRYWHVEPNGARRFSGPVVLLQNRLSVSAADNFALAMRVLPQVTSVGDFTSGCFSDVVGRTLSNGWYCSYVFDLNVDYAGRCWEGVGVPPDYLVRSSDLPDGVTDRVFELGLALVESGGWSPQDESASAEAARVSLSAALAEDTTAAGFAAARQAFVDAQTRLPKDSWYIDTDEMLGLSRRLVSAGRVEDGHGVLELLAQAFPDYMQAHYWLGSAYLRQRQIERGLRSYERAMALIRGQHETEVDAVVGMRLQRSLAEGGVAALKREFQSLEAEHRTWMTEERLNDLGYSLFLDGKVVDAIAVLRLTAEAFPQYWNVHDSLGEAYMVHGEKKLAIASCEKSLKLNPANQHSVEMLERLRGK